MRRFAKRHPTPFREGDRVGHHIIKPSERHGTFTGYCRGYLSHAIVLWDGDALPTRVKASTLRLIERKVIV